MSSINKAIIVGNVGKQPEINTMQSGGEVANFTVATSEKWKDKNGQTQEKTEWHDIVVYNPGLVNVAKNYITKGTKVYIEGQIITSKFTDKNSGVEKYRTSIVLKPYNGTIVLLGGSSGEYKKSEPEQAYSAPKKQEEPTTDFSIGDDIPF